MEPQRPVNTFPVVPVEAGKFVVDPPKSKPFNVPTSDDMIALHSLQVYVGKRGGGKTMAMVTFLRQMKKEKVLDRIFHITPSYGSNKELLHDPKYDLPLDPDDVYKPGDEGCIEDVIGKIEGMAKEYSDYKKARKAYEDYSKALKSIVNDKEILDIDPEILIAAFHWDVMEGPPPPKYGGRKPVCALFIDDCQGVRTDLPTSWACQVPPG